MTTHVLLLDLQDDPQLIAEYEAWHAPGRVPKAVVESIRGGGITSMEIYRTGNRLVMIMDVDPSFDLAAKDAADRVNPEVQAWETLMSKFQQSLPWAQHEQKWVPARRIFNLDDQA